MRPLLPALSAALVCVGLLASCAPRLSADPAPAFRAAFSDYGAAWVSGGQACVARAPEFRVVCPRVGRAVDVAWNGTEAWAAVPGAGLLVTLDRQPRTLPVGAVVALSAQRIYREDGSTLTYSGGSGAQVAGTPSRVVTGGDGEDYVLLAGVVRRLSDSALVGSAVVQPADRDGDDLIATPTGVRRVGVPTAVSSVSEYRLSGGLLERLDLAGQVLAQRPHGPGRVGLVGEEVVTVSAAGEVRRFTADLTPIP